MKRIILLVALVVFSLSMLTGCATLHVNAPSNRDVRLMAESDPVHSRMIMRNWYLLWGLVPISDNSTADAIGRHNYKGVKITTSYTFVDYLIGVLLGWTSLHTRTVYIEAQK